MTKAVYGGLALLMFMGFVFFGIGSSGLSGSIGDLFGQSNGGGSSDASQQRLETAARTADVNAKAAASNPVVWKDLAQARLRLANVGDNIDPANSNYTAAGKRQLTAAGAAWDKYLALKPPTPDETVARQMIQAYLAIDKPDKALPAPSLPNKVDLGKYDLEFKAGQSGDINPRTGFDSGDPLRVEHADGTQEMISSAPGVQAEILAAFA